MKGIDAEVAQFFNETAAGVTKPVVEIDEATNKRLRWMIHRRVLVVMVVTYFAQTLDKGYVAAWLSFLILWTKGLWIEP